jgi:hypothetical protein
MIAYAQRLPGQAELPARWMKWGVAVALISCVTTPAQLPDENVEFDEKGPIPEAKRPSLSAVEDPTWVELRAEFPELASLRVAWLEDPPEWLEQAKQLWWSSPLGCQPATRTQDERFRLEVCRHNHGDHEVICERNIDLADGNFDTGMLHCEVPGPSTSIGFVPASRGRSRRVPLVELGTDQVAYRKAWTIRIEAAQFVQTQEPCIGGGTRRCHRNRGRVVRRIPVGERDMVDHGVFIEKSKDPVDCSRPCPDDSEDLRRYHEWLDTRVFVEAAAEPAAQFFKTREACARGPAATGLVSPVCDTPHPPTR